MNKYRTVSEKNGTRFKICRIFLLIVFMGIFSSCSNFLEIVWSTIKQFGLAVFWGLVFCIGFIVLWILVFMLAEGEFSKKRRKRIADDGAWDRYVMSIGADPLFDEHGRLRNRTEPPKEGEKRIDISKIDEPWERYVISIGADPTYDEYGRLRNRTKK